LQLRLPKHYSLAADRSAAFGCPKNDNPKLVAQLVDLLTRLAENDREVEAANTERPHGEAPMLYAELIARQLAGFARGALSDIPSLRRARLPAFSYTVPSAPLYVWPKEVKASVGLAA
jgi:hypothetical protein